MLGRKPVKRFYQVHLVALRLGMSLVVCLEGFLPVCKVTSRVSQVGFPAGCQAVWEAGCPGDQVEPVLNNFHQTRV